MCVCVKGDTVSSTFEEKLQLGVVHNRLLFVCLYMCSITYYGNINKDTITLSYFLLYYYIVTHNYCTPTHYSLVPALAMGAQHVASCAWPYTILTHSGGEIYTTRIQRAIYRCSQGRIRQLDLA